MTNENRSALLPDRLKRKDHVRKRHQNENNLPSQQLRCSQPWKPAGSNRQGASTVVGVQPLQWGSLTLQELSLGPPLTSTFSVQDSLQALRSSRVFKQKVTVDKQLLSTVQQHDRTLQPSSSSSMGCKPGDRPVLQPIKTSTVLSTGSRASSCGSCSTAGRPASVRVSYSSLDSAVNLCSSPTMDDDGARSIAGKASAVQAAESKPQMQLPDDQQQGLEPEPAAQQNRKSRAAQHIPQLADSCCELLQLLQMDDSPTFSRARNSAGDQLPASPRQVAVKPPAAAAAATGRPRVTAGAAVSAPRKQVQPRENAGAGKPQTGRPAAGKPASMTRARVPGLQPFMARPVHAAGPKLHQQGGAVCAGHGSQYARQHTTITSTAAAAAREPVLQVQQKRQQQPLPPAVLRQQDFTKQQQQSVAQQESTLSEQHQQLMDCALPSVHNNGNQDCQRQPHDVLQQQQPVPLAINQQEQQDMAGCSVQQQSQQPLTEPSAQYTALLQDKLHAMQQQLVAIQRQLEQQQKQQEQQKQQQKQPVAPPSIQLQAVMGEQQQQRRAASQHQPLELQQGHLAMLQKQQHDGPAEGVITQAAVRAAGLPAAAQTQQQQPVSAAAPEQGDLLLQVQGPAPQEDLPLQLQQEHQVEQPQQQEQDEPTPCSSVSQATGLAADQPVKSGVSSQQAGLLSQVHAILQAPHHLQQEEQQPHQGHDSVAAEPRSQQQPDNNLVQCELDEQAAATAQQQDGQQIDTPQKGAPLPQTTAQQPAAQCAGIALMPARTKKQQQQVAPSSYQQLFEGTRALVANSLAVTRHMQGGSSGLSPLKAGASPTRLGPCGSSGPLYGSSPARFRQPSRLSVSQSWLAAYPASPGHMPQRSGSPSMAGRITQLRDTVPEAAEGAGGAVCEGHVRARLFGPEPGAVPATLQLGQQPALHMAQDVAPAAAAATTASLDVSTTHSTFGRAPLHSSLATRQQPAGSSSYDGLTRQPSMLAAPCDTVGHLQEHVNLASLPASPARNRALLCTSRVAQVLFGTPSGKPASMTDTQEQRHGFDAAVGADAGQQGHVGTAADTRSAAGCSNRRHGGAASGAATGSDCDTSDSDSDDDDGDIGAPQRQGAAGVSRAAGGKENRGVSISNSKRGAQSKRGGYGQQAAAECWTVHTNWAADLDPETEAVATAAAAAAGLSAQLGRGSAVRLQEHASPFRPAAASGGLGLAVGVAGQAVQVQLAGCSPMWVSAATGQLSTAAAEEGQAAAGQEQQGVSAEREVAQQDVCAEGEVAQQPPCVCSPMQLMVPRRLWGSPGVEGH